MVDVIERIIALIACLALAILQVMDMDPEHAFTSVPGFHDLVVNPLAIGSGGTDEHHDATASIHLLVDPFFDGLVTTLGDRFPVVIRGRLVAFNGTNVSYLRNTPVIGKVVETVEDATRHGLDPFVLALNLPGGQIH